VLWYKNSVRTSQETHYVSATSSNPLMLLGETNLIIAGRKTLAFSLGGSGSILDDYVRFVVDQVTFRQDYFLIPSVFPY
jgi:hypothetical protein